MVSCYWNWGIGLLLWVNEMYYFHYWTMICNEISSQVSRAKSHFYWTTYLLLLVSSTVPTTEWCKKAVVLFNGGELILLLYSLSITHKQRRPTLLLYGMVLNHKSCSIWMRGKWTESGLFAIACFPVVWWKKKEKMKLRRQSNSIT